MSQVLHPWPILQLHPLLEVIANVLLKTARQSEACSVFSAGEARKGTQLQVWQTASTRARVIGLPTNIPLQQDC